MPRLLCRLATLAHLQFLLDITAAICCFIYTPLPVLGFLIYAMARFRTNYPVQFLLRAMATVTEDPPLEDLLTECKDVAQVRTLNDATGVSTANDLPDLHSRRQSVPCMLFQYPSQHQAVHRRSHSRHPHIKYPSLRAATLLLHVAEVCERVSDAHTRQGGIE